MKPIPCLEPGRLHERSTVLVFPKIILKKGVTLVGEDAPVDFQTLSFLYQRTIEAILTNPKPDRCSNK